MRRAFIALGISTIILASALLPAGAAFKVPPQDGYVTDNAQVLSEEVEQSLEALATELDQKTKAQLAILTVPTLDDTPLENASLEVARQWGVGDKKHSNGLLILLAVDDHKLRTEIGYGLEGTITDGTSGQIQDQHMLPYFKRGDYQTGLLRGSQAYAYRIAKENQVTLSGLNGQAIDTHPGKKQGKDGEGGIPWFTLLFVFFFLLPMFFARRRGAGYYASPFIGGFGGGGYSGDSGSSFGGFGGGDFGGGGSSRGW